MKKAASLRSSHWKVKTISHKVKKCGTHSVANLAPSSKARSAPSSVLAPSQKVKKESRKHSKDLQNKYSAEQLCLFLVESCLRNFCLHQSLRALLLLVVRHLFLVASCYY